MAKGNRNKKCDNCGKRHNIEKPCAVIPYGVAVADAESGPAEPAQEQKPEN